MSRLSAIEICNLAFAHIGVKGITDFNQPNGGTAKSYYDFYIRYLLESHDWSFARKRVKLQSLTTPASVTKYSVAYQLPSDCVKPHMLEPGGSRVQWQVYGQEIHTDVGEAYLYYTSSIDNPEVLSHLFAETLSWLIADKFSITLSDDKTLKNIIRQQYMESYEKSTLADAEIGSDYKYLDNDQEYQYGIDT